MKNLNQFTAKQNSLVTALEIAACVGLIIAAICAIITSSPKAPSHPHPEQYIDVDSTKENTNQSWTKEQE